MTDPAPSSPLDDTGTTGLDTTPAGTGPAPGASGPIPVHVSTSSVYPENAAYAFDLAQRLGYDGVEIMVWTDPVTQEAGALNALANLHELRIGAIHAPTLLLAQRLWGWEPWGKIERALDLAAEVNAQCVVVHPPFRWQQGYAEGFVEGVAEREKRWGVPIAVENMFPWRTGASAMQAYLPGPDPRDSPYAHVPPDIRHAAAATCWSSPGTWPTASGTSTSATPSAPSRTSTSCPAGGRRSAGRCSSCSWSGTSPGWSAWRWGRAG